MLLGINGLLTDARKAYALGNQHFTTSQVYLGFVVQLGFFLNFSNQPTKVLNDGVNGVAIYFILFYHLKIIKFHCLPVRLFISVQNRLFRVARGEIRFGDLSVTLSAVSPSRCSFTTSHFVDGRWSLRSQMSFSKAVSLI